MDARAIDCIGIFGGMFDPVHRAHIRLAKDAGDQLGISKILWIVTGASKNKSEVAPVSDRLEMVKLTLESLNDSRMVLDDREVINADLGLESFMSDTVSSLQHDLPGYRFILILGEDQICGLQTWRRWKWLIRNVDLAICKRPGSQGNNIIDAITAHRGKLHELNSEPDPISSTEIRQSIQKGFLDSNAIPQVVADYILTHHLYQSTVRCK